MYGKMRKTEIEKERQKERNNKYYGEDGRRNSKND
jgi:hypothetical protein